jgi:glycerophosphoryl diester phosphodiesterase
MRRSPEVPAGLLFEAEAALPLRKAWAQHFLHPRALHPEATLCTPDSVRRWQQAGYLVNVWTVDDPHTLHALAAMHVDAVITNDPARTRQILESRV